MKVSKAIEVLAETRRMNINFFCRDRKAALKLGIEALKVLRHGRLSGAHHDPAFLPGETPEEEVKNDD